MRGQHVLQLEERYPLVLWTSVREALARIRISKALTERGKKGVLKGER